MERELGKDEDFKSLRGDPRLTALITKAQQSTATTARSN
jgi:hypothetical protein